MKEKDKKIDGLYIIENREELIKKRKKKKKIRKISLSFSLVIATLITLALKLEVFNVKNIKVTGNHIISEEEILEKSKASVGNNIFKVNTSDIQKSVAEHKYIYEAKVERKLPDTLVVEIKEREASFYEYIDRSFYIIDNQGHVLENKNSIEGMNLVRVTGIVGSDEPKVEDSENEDDVTDDTHGYDAEELAIRKGEILEEVSNLIKLNTSDVAIKEVNVEDITDIYITLNNMKVYVGTVEKLDQKLNVAVNIIKEKDLEEMNGYIDISFDGNPVLYIEP